MTQTHFHHRVWRELISHKLSYTVLALGLLGFIWLFIWVGQQLVMQRYIMIGLGVFYVIWGVVTHVSNQRITSQLILEYLVVGILASASLLLLTI
ncbi:MAG: hypothetical protein ABIJ03_00880 [Patescibacteria group bacterium]|nr:hypothetical protein [Patescibacteria group bacterium]